MRVEANSRNQLYMGKRSLVEICKLLSNDANFTALKTITSKTYKSPLKLELSYAHLVCMNIDYIIENTLKKITIGIKPMASLHIDRAVGGCRLCPLCPAHLQPAVSGGSHPLWACKIACTIVSKPSL